MRGSMLALAVTAIGGGIEVCYCVGVLSLPYVCKLCGLIFGMILLAFGYLAARWSFSMIIDVDTKGGSFKGFKGFCQAVGGKRLVLFYSIILCFTIYGTMIGYQVIIASMIQRIMLSAGIDNCKDYRIYHVAILSVFVIFPLSLLSGVSNLRYATILSITSIAYTTIVTIIELPFFWINGKADISKLVYFRLDWSFFSAFGITFFAFMSQTGFYSAVEQLGRRNEGRLRRITNRAVTIDLSFYVLITLAGYMSTLDDTTDLIIDRETPFKGSKVDIPMTIAQVLICCSLCIGTPLNFIPMRKIVFDQMFGGAEDQPANDEDNNRDPTNTFKRLFIHYNT